MISPKQYADGIRATYMEFLRTKATKTSSGELVIEDVKLALTMSFLWYLYGGIASAYESGAAEEFLIDYCLQLDVGNKEINDDLDCAYTNTLLDAIETAKGLRMSEQKFSRLMTGELFAGMGEVLRELLGRRYEKVRAWAEVQYGRKGESDWHGECRQGDNVLRVKFEMPLARVRAQVIKRRHGA